MRRRWWMLMLVVLVAVAACGLNRVRMDTDPLGMLPGEMPEVAGLRAFQEGFSRSNELVVVLEGEEDLPERAEELGRMLLEAQLCESARWQPQYLDDPEGMTGLFAWLWLNARSEILDDLLERLSEESIDDTLETSLEAVATSLDGGSMMLGAHDPLGLLAHPALSSFMESAGEGGGGFLSADGRTHLLLLQSPVALDGYQDAGDWIGRLREIIDPWSKEHGLTVGLTGDPAFEAEIGGAMQSDMSSTIAITSMLIGVLFLLMQRRFFLLAGLSVVLAGVFATALVLAGWIYGELSIMAAGFAAILIGLAVDYGVLICQEAKVAGHDEDAIRKATRRSILAASLTTAAVFLALNMSGLPGIAQLGTIVAIGIVAGAVLMLAWYVPWVARVGAGRETIAHKRARVPGRKGALYALLALAVGATTVLVTSGTPDVGFDRSLLRPRNSTAMDAFEKIEQAFPGFGEAELKLLLRDAGDAMPQRMKEVSETLEALQQQRPDLVKGYDLPADWWPSPERVEANRERMEQLAADKDRLLLAADEFGYSEEGLALDRKVLEAIPDVLTMEAGGLPDAPAARELLRGVMSVSGEERLLLGKVEVADVGNITPEDFELLRTINSDGVWLSGWPLIRPAMQPLVKRDLTHVFLPMVGVMLVMLTLVFRDWKDVLTTVLAMVLSGVLLLAAMRLFDLEWNFLNIAATPLLLGTCLDYMIHMLLSIRRTGGDVRAVWNGTGKAVIFCGCSTAIGFGSLAFASIDGLASLGKVALTGILISMLVSVVLVPALRGGRER